MADRLQSLRHQEQRVERTRRDPRSLRCRTISAHRSPTSGRCRRRSTTASSRTMDRRAIRPGDGTGPWASSHPSSTTCSSSCRSTSRDEARIDRVPVGDLRRIGDCGRGARRLPQGGRPRRRRSSRGRWACSPHLARVLQNLLVNAVRHTPAGGVVRVDVVRSNGDLRLGVEDTGEGIPRRGTAVGVRSVLPRRCRALRERLRLGLTLADGSSGRSAARSSPRAGATAGRGVRRHAPARPDRALNRS